LNTWNGLQGGQPGQVYYTDAAAGASDNSDGLALFFENLAVILMTVFKIFLG